MLCCVVCFSAGAFSSGFDTNHVQVDVQSTWRQKVVVCMDKVAVMYT